MRAEAHRTCGAGSAGPVRGQVNRFGSARPEVPVASSTRPAASYGATSTRRLLLIELDALIHTDARPLATSIRCGIDTAVQVLTTSDPSTQPVSHDASPTGSSRPPPDPEPPTMHTTSFRSTTPQGQTGARAFWGGPSCFA